ncbi:ankyrin repeat domain protein [Talaromyces pinophilus]|uniref:Ankyrin repeat domain protein n=1 Tax=Talaromyces pinophilus TaxID=128442 RepID=A0A510NVU5_TALPI|nr:ankyrin repeat domain protein [Talaromyces pinophilus]
MPRKLKFEITDTVRKEWQWLGVQAAALSGSEDAFRLVHGRLLDAKDKRGRTALHWAATIGNGRAVKVLLERNADIKSKDSIFGRTPLHWAAKHGRDEIILQLLRKDADLLDIGDRHGATALHYAAENGHEEVVKLLLESKADPNVQDQYKRTPLMWAIVNEHELVVRLLLDNGAHVDRKDNFGRTTLSLIAMNGQEELMTALVEKGADINSRDNNGWTPVWQASLNGNEKILQLLIEKGADVEAQAERGSTPLLWAAKNRHEIMVVSLLRAGANPRFQDGAGRTPYVWAYSTGNVSIAKRLLGITQVFGDVKTGIAQRDLGQLRDVMRILDKSHDDFALEWLLGLLWPPHGSRKGSLRETLFVEAVSDRDADAAVSLAEEIAKHCWRLRGPLHVDNLAITVLLSRLSTMAGRRVQHLNLKKAANFYQDAAAVHESILESFVRNAVNAERSGNESSAVERYVDVPKHFYLLKLALERLGWWPKDYSIYERLNAKLYLHFGKYLAGFEGVERWNLGQFGLGRAEADDDLLNLDNHIPTQT